MIKEKRKTYAQSAQIKKDKELGRGYRQGAGSANYRDRAGPIRPGTYKLSIAELKQRTRCKRCNKFGHWHRECPNPPAAGSSRDHQKETHLLEIDLEPYEDSLFCHYLEAEDHQGPHSETELEPDILSRSFEPKGYGKGALRVSLNQFTPIMIEVLSQSERALTSGQHGEFEVLNLVSQCPLECKDVQVFKDHLEEIRPEHLRELRDDVNRVLNKRQTDDFDMYMQFREWKKNKKGPASSKDGSFEMIKEEDSESGCTLDSGYTHFNKRTGSRGRRLATPSPASPGRPPRGPPPPQPVTARLPTKTQSSSRMSTSSANSSKATKNKIMEVDHEKLRYESNALITEKKAQQEMFTSAFHILIAACRFLLEGFPIRSGAALSQIVVVLLQHRLVLLKEVLQVDEANLFLTMVVMSTSFPMSFRKSSLGRCFEAARVHAGPFLTRDPNTPICDCRRGCKVELSATTQIPNKVFYNCANSEPQSQCGVFRWAPVQPLLDEEFREMRTRVAKGYPRDLTSRELLVRILQDSCPHHSTVASGSNAFVQRTRCRICHKVINIERKMNSSPEMTSGNETEHFDDQEYEAFVQWKRDRY
ncbi:hypothetical protein AK812_SmicGene37953 [Symbiodinium microadriaticum]|uniref:CCHC-type domain-containing protein n=1 Tax=Symbiodinium microadriaticum TaxID=2951 RepID=A0A1Q9CEZ4_SYMMI|nr:hypothetical protein AK812_SmicGene37953 [Symbiodinium microadriaticum]